MELVRSFKALAEPNRLRALAALRDRELCACQIVALLKLAPSTVSKHMSILVNSGLVQSVKRGRWVYFAWTEKPKPAIASILQILPNLFAGDRQIQQDAGAMKEILTIDPELLCERQAQKP